MELAIKELSRNESAPLRVIDTVDWGRGAVAGRAMKKGECVTEFKKYVFYHRNKLQKWIEMKRPLR